MAPFVVLMFFRAILIIPCEKVDCESSRFFRINFLVSPDSGPSPLPQNDHLKPKLSLCYRFAMKRERCPFFICVFYSLWLHKTQGEKNLDSRSCILLTYE